MRATRKMLIRDRRADHDHGGEGRVDVEVSGKRMVSTITDLASKKVVLLNTGPVVDVMNQMGPMKMVQKIASVSTDAVPDDVFTVPAGCTPQK